MGSNIFIHKSKIFEEFPELLFGFSTKQFLDETDSFGFNMSRSVGDDNKIVLENRRKFFKKFGFTPNNVVLQKQIHSDIINIVEHSIEDLVGDALITKSTNLGLAISTADCTNIYLYDPIRKVIAAVHSGWAGTEKKILTIVLKTLRQKFNSDYSNLFAFIAPSISQENYEVGQEFKNKFEKKYLIPIGGKYLLDLKTANLDILLSAGVPETHIEISNICSYGNYKYHSFRRDKKRSGRALGLIAMKKVTHERG